MKTPRRKHRARGFTLIDTTLAMGLLSVMVLPILGLLAVGVKDSGEAQTRRTCEGLRQRLRICLQDPKWPESRSELTGDLMKWKATRYFDRRGELLKDSEKKSAWMEVRMEASESTAFRSAHLEQVKAVFYRTGSGKKVEQTVIQRLCAAEK